MTRTPIRFTLYALITVVMFSLAGVTAYAAKEVFVRSKPHVNITWGVLDSEFVRVCLVGLVTRPPSAGISWEIGFFDADGETLLTKQVELPEQGFRCVDTTPEDLRFAGFEPDSSGRLQFGLRIAFDEQVIVPDQKPEKLSLGGIGYHSVETIDVVSNATKQAVKIFGYAGAKGKYTIEVVQ